MRRNTFPKCRAVFGTAEDGQVQNHRNPKTIRKGLSLLAWFIPHTEAAVFKLSTIALPISWSNILKRREHQGWVLSSAASYLQVLVQFFFPKAYILRCSEVLLSYPGKFWNGRPCLLKIRQDLTAFKCFTSHHEGPWKSVANTTPWY
jgi:hypothetical protein